MNYNPQDKESARHAVLAAMIETSGFNNAIKQLNQKLKVDPSCKAIVEQDKGYIKFKYAEKKNKKEEPAPAPAPALENNNNAPAVQEAPAAAKQKSKIIGTKEQVYYGERQRTSGGLTKDDLMLSKGKVISKKKHDYGKSHAAERLKNYQAQKKLNAQNNVPEPSPEPEAEIKHEEEVPEDEVFEE